MGRYVKQGLKSLYFPAHVISDLAKLLTWSELCQVAESFTVRTENAADCPPPPRPSVKWDSLP